MAKARHQGRPGGPAAPAAAEVEAANDAITWAASAALPGSARSRFARLFGDFATTAALVTLARCCSESQCFAVATARQPPPELIRKVPCGTAVGTNSGFQANKGA